MTQQAISGRLKAALLRAACAALFAALAACGGNDSSTAASAVASGCATGNGGAGGSPGGSFTGSVHPVLSISVKGNCLMDALGNTVQLRGVNVSGLESGVILRGGTDYWQSSNLGGRPDFNRIASWKANAVRLPLNEDSWLGLKVTGIPGNVVSIDGTAYQAEVAATVAAANAAGLYVILDLHWSAPAHFAANTQNPFMDADNSVTFWISLAQAFKNNPAVMFELFNEPFVCPVSKGAQCSAPEGTDTDKAMVYGGTESYYWGLSSGTYGGEPTRVAYAYHTAGFQQVINAIRGTAATNVIICGGNSFDDDLSWWSKYPVTDPLNQLAAALHQYPNSYPYTVTSKLEELNAILKPIVAKHPLILTEMGDEVGIDPAPFAIQLLTWADTQGYSVMAWTWNPWGGTNTLIQNTTNYTPTMGLGETYYNWTYYHQ
jgi:hypothetical protein